MIAKTMTRQGGSTSMQMRLELVPLPVSDVDRAIAFYADKLGFNKDVDVQPRKGVRVVQLTPQGSSCSVGFGTGLDVYAGEPGSVRGLHLVVDDIAEARADLVRRGVEISEVHDFGGGVKGAGILRPRRQHAGTAGDGVAQGRGLLVATSSSRRPRSACGPRPAPD